MRLLTQEEERRGASQGTVTEVRYEGLEACRLFEKIGGFESPDRIASDDQRALFLKFLGEAGYVYLDEFDPDREHENKLLSFESVDGSGIDAATNLFYRLVDGLELKECEIAQCDIFPLTSHSSRP